MSTIKKFEDLLCWQKARELTKAVYGIFRNLDMPKYRDYGFQDQIQRASVSVMSNIAEGFERGTKFELINYFYIAKGSCAEVRCQLQIANDLEYVDMPKFQHIYGLADETGRLIQSFVDKVKSSARSGLQFKAPKPNNAIPENIKDIIGDDLELAKYYDPRTRNINWGKYHEDKRQKQNNI